MILNKKNILLLVILFFGFRIAYADSVVIEQPVHSIGLLNVVGTDNNGNLRSASQSFKTTSSDPITAVSILAQSKDGNPTSQFVVRLETSVNGCPSGTLVNPDATTTVIPQAGVFIKATFPNPVVISNNTTYSIVIIPSNVELTNNDWLFYGSSNTYSDGYTCERVNGAYYSYQSYDLAFQIWTASTTAVAGGTASNYIATGFIKIDATSTANPGSGFDQTESRLDIYNDEGTFPNAVVWTRFRMKGFDNGVPLQDVTDSMGGIQDNSSTSGGIRVYGIASNAPTAWRTVGIVATPSASNALDTVPTSSVIENQGMKKDLAQIPDNTSPIGDTENLFQIANYHFIRFLMKGNGDTIFAGKVGATGFSTNGHNGITGNGACTHYENGLCTSF